MARLYVCWLSEWDSSDSDDVWADSPHHAAEEYVRNNHQEILKGREDSDPNVIHVLDAKGSMYHFRVTVETLYEYTATEIKK